MRTPRHRRPARTLFENLLVLLGLLFVANVVVFALDSFHGAGSPSRFWKWLGVFFVLVAVANVRGLSRLLRVGFSQSRLMKKLGWLESILKESEPHANAKTLRRVVDHLSGKDTWTLHRHSARALYCLVRSNPSLRECDPATRCALERVLFSEFGFATTLRDLGSTRPLLEFVTLGAKLGAGSEEKRISPVTHNAAELARWIVAQREDSIASEIQIGLGYDTGAFPWHDERARFLALYLFIATTDLDRFQALARAPERDPNAAFGLLIRGERVQSKFPGQRNGHRLDFVLPLPTRMAETNLAHFLREIQELQLGLLLACVEDVSSILLGAWPPWFSGTMAYRATRYREFERSFVRLLRRFDRYRNPARIYPLEPNDHEQRTRAFEQHRLEECLYPNYSWVVPLYSADTRWNWLLPVLRGIEGMMLHQGPATTSNRTVGQKFIGQVRLLGYETVVAMQEGRESQESEPCSLDPFIDPSGEGEATEEYRSRIRALLEQGELSVELTPDPSQFRLARGRTITSKLGEAHG